MAAALPKILVLHGYTQSATIFSKRMGAMRKSLAKDFEMVFVDAPHILLPADLVNSFGANAPSLEALGAGEAKDSNEDPALLPRAWWKTNTDRTQMFGLDETFISLRDILKQHRFEGVWGFSQGAALASLLCALLERPEILPSFLIDGSSPHPPFSFAVCVAGFRPRGTLSDVIFERPYETRTLHVLGRTDIIVVEERARPLLDITANKRVIWHEGGHFVPSKGPWRTFFRSYLLDPAGEIAAPGEVGDSSHTAPPSAEASGAATPATRASTPPITGNITQRQLAESRSAADASARGDASEEKRAAAL